MSKARTPVGLRKGIEISEETRKEYMKRNKKLDLDRDAPSLPPDRWAQAMRRDEFFRPRGDLARH